MGKIVFTKMVGSGNDFVVIDHQGKGHESRAKGFNALAERLCKRKTGIGANGLLILEKSKTADFRMAIFNADGSEAEMCGNGLRCAVLYAGRGKIKVETKAGIYEGEITGKDKVRVRMEDSKDLRLDFPITLNGRKLRANFINTGVPHTVIFVQGLDKMDIKTIGSQIRYHNEFKPKGTNVDFVEIIDSENIKMRTYERGVEGETLACGTGAVASAIITSYKVPSNFAKLTQITKSEINVHASGGILKVEFKKIVNEVRDVYLEGEAKIVFEGGIYV